MKPTSALFCTCLLFMAGSTFGQNQANANSQTQANAPTTSSTNQQGGMQNDTGQSSMMGPKMTTQQCRDLKAMELNNPGMTRDAKKDQTCASMMQQAKGNAGPSASTRATQSN